MLRETVLYVSVRFSIGTLKKRINKRNIIRVPKSSVCTYLRRIRARGVSFDRASNAIGNPSSRMSGMNNGRINVAGPKPARRAALRRYAGSFAADFQEQSRNLQTVREHVSASWNASTNLWQRSKWRSVREQSLKAMRLLWSLRNVTRVYLPVVPHCTRSSHNGVTKAFMLKPCHKYLLKMHSFKHDVEILRRYTFNVSTLSLLCTILRKTIRLRSILINDQLIFIYSSLLWFLISLTDPRVSRTKTRGVKLLRSF